MKCQYGDLIHEYKKETNAKTKERMLAVINVIEKGASISLVAQMFHKVYNTVKNWVFRFERYGMSEKQRSGRPPKMTDHKITEFFTNVRNGIFPKQIVRKIKKDTGIKYTESGTHNVLRRHNFTPKVPRLCTQEQGILRSGTKVAKVTETMDFVRKTGRF